MPRWSLCVAASRLRPANLSWAWVARGGCGLFLRRKTLSRQLAMKRASHTGTDPFGRGTLLAAVLSAVCWGLLPMAGAAVAGRWPGAVIGAAVGAAAYATLCWRARAQLDLTALRRHRPTPELAVNGRKDAA